MAIYKQLIQLKSDLAPTKKRVAHNGYFRCEHIVKVSCD